MDTVRNGQFSLANTNKMLKTYNGMIGLKTGYISEAGYCISAAATRDNMTFIATVMGAKTKDDRTNAVKTLLDYGFANYTAYTPDLTEATKPILVELGKKQNVSIEAKQTEPVIIPKESEGNITLEIERLESLTAPIKKGQSVGTATVRDGTRTIMQIELVTSENIEKLGFSDIYREFMKFALMKKN